MALPYYSWKFAFPLCDALSYISRYRWPSAMKAARATSGGYISPRHLDFQINQFASEFEGNYFISSITSMD